MYYKHPNSQIVHYNRLKLCQGDPEKCTMSRESEQTNQLERDEVLSSVDPSPDMG